MMNADLVKWLFERKAVFALIATLCLTALRFREHMSDTTFGLCFGSVVGLLAIDILKAAGGGDGQ